jgi:hypothetical protein
MRRIGDLIGLCSHSSDFDFIGVNRILKVSHFRGCRAATRASQLKTSFDVRIYKVFCSLILRVPKTCGSLPLGGESGLSQSAKVA